MSKEVCFQEYLAVLPYISQILGICLIPEQLLRIDRGILPGGPHYKSLTALV